MRPVVSEQNPLRYPLNELFGTQAHVRLLRVMANEVDDPLTTSDVAKHSKNLIHRRLNRKVHWIPPGYPAVRLHPGAHHAGEMRS